MGEETADIVDQRGEEQKRRQHISIVVHTET